MGIGPLADKYRNRMGSIVTIGKKTNRISTKKDCKKYDYIMETMVKEIKEREFMENNCNNINIIR